MVIDTIQDVSTSTVTARNNDTVTTALWNSDPQEPTDMLHALHRDEKELRVLAVILSLTGGLVLSFLLGVGIFVYWHWRSYRTRQRKKLTRLKQPPSSIQTTTTAPESHLSVQVTPAEDLPPTAPSSPSSSPRRSSRTSSVHSLHKHQSLSDRSSIDMAKANGSVIDKFCCLDPSFNSDPSPSSSPPIPTAPPAKECLASSSSRPSSSNQLNSLDPPDLPPPAYSPH